MRRLSLVALALAGCTSSRTVGQPTLYVHDATIQIVQHDQIDILFMIDNSSSMTPKQDALRANFPLLLKRIMELAQSGTPASYHIGVVDSDLGSGTNTMSCLPGGDGGRLRTGPEPNIGNPPAACAMLQLGNGENFIDLDLATGVSNVANIDVGTAFTCLASVGDVGCGFEHQLESVYRALTTPALNPGFLRDDALLVVVWLTDEDDCSAPDDSNLFDVSNKTYGPLSSFRCTRAGVTCNGAPLTGGSQMGGDCVPAVGGPLFDVARYTTLFTADRANGGIKDDPSDVLLVSIAAPPTPVNVELTTPCAANSADPSCAILDHSCVSSSDVAVFGDPAVRIHSVLSASANAIESSICDDDYNATIDAMADAMAARLRGGCLPGAVVDRADPGCQVTLDGADLPRCISGRLPCWDLVDDAGCAARMTPAGASQQLRFTVEGAASGAVVASCPLYEPTP